MAYCETCEQDVSVHTYRNSEGDPSVPGGVRHFTVSECEECGGISLWTDESMTREYEPD